MAGRIRSIKPELLEDAVTAGLSDSAFRVFIGMILLSDDHGNLRAEPKYIEGQVYWSAVPEKGVRESLQELLALVTYYRVRGQLYCHINGWSKHQRVQHPGNPRVPRIEEKDSGDSHESLTNFHESLAPDLRSPISDHRPHTVADATGGLSPEETLRVRVITNRPPALVAVASRSDVDEVLDHWAIKLYPGRKPLFDDKRRKRVKSRLREGFTVERLKLAIDGALKDDFLMGLKQGSPKNGYRDVATVLRDAAQVERLIELAPKKPTLAPSLPRNDFDDQEGSGESTQVRKLAREAPSEIPLSVEEQGKRAAEIAIKMKAIGLGGAK